MVADAFDPALQHRISLTRPGQVTWANPALGKSCETCAHLCNSRSKRNGEKVAVCSLVKVHSRKPGKEFLVEGAVACSMWRAVE
jgi:hypothetical protein